MQSTSHGQGAGERPCPWERDLTPPPGGKAKRRRAAERIMLRGCRLRRTPPTPHTRAYDPPDVALGIRKEPSLSDSGGDDGRDYDDRHEQRELGLVDDSGVEAVERGDRPESQPGAHQQGSEPA